MVRAETQRREGKPVNLSGGELPVKTGTRRQRGNAGHAI